MVGYVYAFESPSMPGIVKIGATERYPTERLHDANESDTWRPPEAYDIAWAVEVDAPFIVEKQIHESLAGVRVNPRREFFRVTADEARSLVMSLAVVARPLAVQTTPVPSETEASYEALKAQFELRHFKTENGRYPFHSISLMTGEVVSRSMEAFKVAYMDWIPTGGKQFLDKWLNDGRKRSYVRIDYSCVKKEDQESTVYYAFPEMRHEKLSSSSSPEEKQANVDYFLDYIRLLVEDKDAYVEWLVMWLADILVNPDDKGQTPVSVVLWGGQGAGKTLLCELMARLLGEKLVHRTDDPMRNGDIMAAAGDFNSTLKYKLFIEFEEINFKTHTQVADRIKALITERTHTITHKGQDSVDVRATERILFTTSAAGSVVIENGDRRYTAFAVSTRRIGDAQYWNEHYAKLKDQSYVKDVAEYLVSHKEALGRYAIGDRRPMTEYYRSLQPLSPSPELDFLRDMFLNCVFGQEFLAQFVSGAGLYAIPSSMMCGEYNRWRAENGLAERTSSKSFTMKMVSRGSVYGIRRDTRGTKYNAFVIDSAKLREALARDF